MTETEPRYRLGYRQSMKNTWAIDGTIENGNDTITLPLTKEDLGDTKKVKLGVKLWEIIKEAEDEGRKNGRKLVSDLE